MRQAMFVNVYVHPCFKKKNTDALRKDHSAMLQKGDVVVPKHGPGSDPNDCVNGLTGAQKVTPKRDHFPTRNLAHFNNCSLLNKQPLTDLEILRPLEYVELFSDQLVL